ncbi:hypothetical protein GINT2_001235 [Glugoides intestinalis]
MCGFIKYKNNADIISTGIPTLDSILTLNKGTLTCIYEDETSFIHNTLLQTFISTCSESNSPYFVLSAEEKLLTKFRAREDSSEEVLKNLQIAWRYKDLKGTSEIAEQKFKWSLISSEEVPKEVILKDLDSLLELLTTKKDTQMVIFSLFAPLYGFFSSDKIFKILFQIKKYARINQHTILLSLPKFLIPQETSIFFDNILQISSNLLLPHEDSIYNSFLNILRLTTAGALRVNCLESTKYGIVLRAKCIKVESIDIPPDGNNTESTSNCSQSF